VKPLRRENEITHYDLRAVEALSALSRQVDNSDRETPVNPYEQRRAYKSHGAPEAVN